MTEVIILFQLQYFCNSSLKAAVKELFKLVHRCQK